MQPGPVQSLARLESPGAWQRIGAGAAYFFAGSLALLLLSAYGGVRRSWAAPTALVALGLSLAAFIAALVAYHAFGITADTRAVVVWRAGTLRSIPTEADVSQKTTSLSAGSTAIADKDFLGWIRLTFPNGQTGWVPRGEAIFLWRSPPG
jgi:ABC-type Fe3+-siderophore transport system permease subunit